MLRSPSLLLPDRDNFKRHCARVWDYIYEVWCTEISLNSFQWYDIFRNSLIQWAAHTRVRNNYVAIIEIEFATVCWKRKSTRFSRLVDFAKGLIGLALEARIPTLCAQSSPLVSGYYVGKSGKKSPTRASRWSRRGKGRGFSERIRFGRIRSVCRAQIPRRS